MRPLDRYRPLSLCSCKRLGHPCTQRVTAEGQTCSTCADGTCVPSQYESGGQTVRVHVSATSFLAAADA